MISVIIPCYNAEKYVYSAVLSILSQTKNDIEVIVVDDASEDNSLQELNRIKDSRLMILSNNNNKGYLKSINLLLSHTARNFIAFQDADDLSHPDRLRLQFEFLMANPDISIVGTNYSLINEKGKIIKSQSVEENSEVLAEQLKIGNPFQKPSIMFRRSVYEKIGGFREEFLSFKNISEDYDWLLRASHYFHFGNINGIEPLYQYRSVGNAMTKGFTHVEQLFGHKIAQFLYQERIDTGKDAIELGKLQNVFDFVTELKKPYDLDSSLFYKERSEALMYHGLKFQAVIFAFKALQAKFNWKNIKLLQYCIRKSLFRI